MPLATSVAVKIPCPAMIPPRPAVLRQAALQPSVAIGQTLKPESFAGARCRMNVQYPAFSPLAVFGLPGVSSLKPWAMLCSYSLVFLLGGQSTSDDSVCRRAFDVINLSNHATYSMCDPVLIFILAR